MDMNNENEINLTEAEENCVTGIIVEESGINWKQKLSSRKLWAAAAAAVLSVLTALFGENLPAEAVEVLKTGICALVAYIFGEGAIDIARIIGQSKVDAVSAVPININIEESGRGTEE